MASKKFKVVSLTVMATGSNDASTLMAVVKGNLTQARAHALADKLNNQQERTDLSEAGDPSKIVSYMVKPS